MTLTYRYKRTGSVCQVEEGSLAHTRILGEDAAKYERVKTDKAKADKPAKADRDNPAKPADAPKETAPAEGSAE